MRPLGVFAFVEMFDAATSLVTAVRGARGTVAAVVVVEDSMSTGVPSRSGTRVCVGPDAGGGTGAVLRAAVVLVAFVVVVVVVGRVVEVVDVVVGVSTDVDGEVVGAGSVVVGTCARASRPTLTRQNASAPKQRQITRRTASS